MFKLITFIFLILPQSIFSIIIDSKDYHEILNQIEREAPQSSSLKIVGIDIDNTSLKMKGIIGSDQWFYWQEKLLGKQSPYRVARDYSELLSIYYRIMGNAETTLTDPKILDFIAEARKMGYKFFGITARGHQIAYPSTRELSKNFINYENDLFRGDAYYLGTPKGFQRQILLQDGIIYTAGQHKGKALDFFLDKFNLEPSYATIIDDKIKNVNQFLESMEQRRIKTLGVRYGLEDDAVKLMETPRYQKKALVEFREFKKQECFQFLN